jgi:hypothetical protein
VAVEAERDQAIKQINEESVSMNGLLEFSKNRLMASDAYHIKQKSSMKNEIEELVKLLFYARNTMEV